MIVPPIYKQPLTAIEAIPRRKPRPACKSALRQQRTVVFKYYWATNHRIVGAAVAIGPWFPHLPDQIGSACGEELPALEQAGVVPVPVCRLGAVALKKAVPIPSPEKVQVYR